MIFERWKLYVYVYVKKNNKPKEKGKTNIKKIESPFFCLF